MLMPRVEKIYTNEEEIEEFNSFKREVSKEGDTIRLIFENGRLLGSWGSILEKLEKLNALDAASGILNELTSKQMKIFEEAVKRRSLFK
ncbi:MAG: hypothetical protein ACE5K0_11615 [Candidatus Methanofastidiosia archaeon]